LTEGIAPIYRALSSRFTAKRVPGEAGVRQAGFTLPGGLTQDMIRDSATMVTTTTT